MKRPDERPIIKIGNGTFAEVIRAFYESANFKRLEAGTQQNYRHYLGLAERPDSLGSKPVELMRPSLVQYYLDAFADRPGAQKMARTAIKSLEAWAVVRDFLPYPITTGLEIVGSDGGHKPWNDAQVALAEEKVSKEWLRRAIILASNTGQRGSDLVRMHPSHIEEIDGRLGINVKQKKTGLELWVPMTRQLVAKMETWPRRPAPFLIKDDGSSWKRNDLTMAWQREREGNPELEPCRNLVMHGLRATACVRLRRAGCSILQICDMVGLSAPMVERYCRFASQPENALAAMDQMERNSVVQFPNQSGTKIG